MLWEAIYVVTVSPEKYIMERKRALRFTCPCILYGVLQLGLGLSWGVWVRIR